MVGGIPDLCFTHKFQATWYYKKGVFFSSFLDRRERERKSWWVGWGRWRGEGQKERENLKQTLHPAWSSMWAWSHDPEIMAWAEIRSVLTDWATHAPQKGVFFYCTSWVFAKVRHLGQCHAHPHSCPLLSLPFSHCGVGDGIWPTEGVRQIKAVWDNWICLQGKWKQLMCPGSIAEDQQMYLLKSVASQNDSLKENV